MCSLICSICLLMEQIREHIVRLNKWSFIFLRQQGDMLNCELLGAVTTFKKVFQTAFCEKGTECEQWMPCFGRRIEQKFEDKLTKLEERIRSLQILSERRAALRLYKASANAAAAPRGL